MKGKMTMDEIQKFVLAASDNDGAKAKDCLQKVMKKKVAEKLVKVLSQSKEN